MKKIIYIILFSLFLIFLIFFVHFLYKNSDYYNKKIIERQLNSKYTVTFDYITKSKDESTGRKLYYYSCNEMESIIVEGSVGGGYNSPIPLLPFIYYKTYSQDFTEKLVKYVVDKKCDSTIDITNMDMDEATSKIKYLMKEIERELKPYTISTSSYMGVNLIVKRATKSKELHFSYASDYSIQSSLKEIIPE